tara:strand:+ start:237 stop:1127 length:891 start_codon:yes stop_codon:yes gene_type:complete
MPYLLAASLIWAFSYGLIKSQLTSLDPNFVAACRMTVAFIVFLPLIKFKKNKPLVPYLVLVGAIQYGIMYLLVLRAYQYLDAYQVVLFTATTPFYVMFFHAIFERRFTAYHFMIAGLAILGGGIIYQTSAVSLSAITGFGLVQASDICFSFGQVYYRKIRLKHPDIDDQAIYGFIFLGAALTTILSTTWFHGWHSVHQTTVKQGLLLIYLGAIPSGLCFFWWNKGATQTNPVILSVFNNLKLPLATLVSIIFFHEHVKQGMHLAIGLCIILFALFLAHVSQRRNHNALPGMTDGSQ